MNLSVGIAAQEKRDQFFQSEGISALDELSEMVSITDLAVVKNFIKIDDFADQKTKEEVYEVIRASGAFLTGHFKLLSGKHSEHFIRFRNISKNTKNLNLICEIIYNKLVMERLDFDTILAPETAGSAIAMTIAQLFSENNQKAIHTICAKTDAEKRPTSLINWTDLKPNSKVLLVNDLITTGAGMTELANLAKKYGGNVVGICVFSARTNLHELEVLKNNDIKVVFSLTDSSKFNLFTYDEKPCEICKKSEKKPIKSCYLN